MLIYSLLSRGNVDSAVCDFMVIKLIMILQVREDIFSPLKVLSHLFSNL